VWCTGHLIAGADDAAGKYDSIEVILEQCRAQNRQLISEMRELLCVFDIMHQS